MLAWPLRPGAGVKGPLLTPRSTPSRLQNSRNCLISELEGVINDTQADDLSSERGAMWRRAVAISSSHSRRVQSCPQLLIHPSPELPSTRHQQMKDGAGDGP